jgi:excinuclease UvrABC helicase subunit UvrB
MTKIDKITIYPARQYVVPLEKQQAAIENQRSLQRAASKASSYLRPRGLRRR